VIERLRELDEAATPGPWRDELMGSEGAIVMQDGFSSRMGALPRRIARVTGQNFQADKANAAVIAEVRTRLPEIIAVLEAAEDLEAMLTQPATVFDSRLSRAIARLSSALAALDAKGQR
jgi:hypothetical protein